MKRTFFMTLALFSSLLLSACSGSTAFKPQDSCGDGIKEDNEQCDIKIVAGKPGACETEVSCKAKEEEPGNECKIFSLAGELCGKQCTFTEKTEAKPGDGCCPEGKTAAEDPDCLKGQGTPYDSSTCTGDGSVAYKYPSNKGGIASICSKECTDSNQCHTGSVCAPSISISSFNSTPPRYCMPKCGNPTEDDKATGVCGKLGLVCNKTDGVCIPNPPIDRSKTCDDEKTCTDIDPKMKCLNVTGGTQGYCVIPNDPQDDSNKKGLGESCLNFRECQGGEHAQCIPINPDGSGYCTIDCGSSSSADVCTEGGRNGYCHKDENNNLYCLSRCDQASLNNQCAGKADNLKCSDESGGDNSNPPDTYLCKFVPPKAKPNDKLGTACDPNEENGEGFNEACGPFGLCGIVGGNVCFTECGTYQTRGEGMAEYKGSCGKACSEDADCEAVNPESKCYLSKPSDSVKGAKGVCIAKTNP